MTFTNDERTIIWDLVIDAQFANTNKFGEPIDPNRAAFFTSILDKLDS